MWEENGELNLEFVNYKDGAIFSVTQEEIFMGTPNKNIIIRGSGKIIGSYGKPLFNM